MAAERRQLTIVFVDLVGSTALASRLDPEDLQDVIRAYQRTVGAVVDRFGGSVAQYLGDGLLVYFGYPHALENTGESAVRGALAVVQAIDALRLPQGVTLKVRIGIATGLVVVGDVASGAVAERLAIGDTPNVAARIQAMAPENAVLVAESTRRVLGEHFVLADLGEHALKGVGTPMRVWRVESEVLATTRYAAMRAGSNAPLIGRPQELERILHAWRLTCEEGGRIVFVTGEAGMGKSRLVIAALEAPDLRPAATVCLQCSPYHAQSAFFPLRTWLRVALEDADDPEARLGELLGRAGIGPEGMRRFADLISADFAHRHPPAQGTPEHERRETSRGFLGLLMAAAAGAPLVVVIEDLHWADPSTLEFIELLSERLATLPVMLLTTARPTFLPSWIEQATLVRVENLDPAAAAALIASTARVPLAKELIDRIVAQTDGVPLFVEELTRTVLESAGGTGHAAMPQDLTLPQTLRDSLTLRLDRLQSGKAVAQVAATLGRHFEGRILRAVWHGSQAKLRQGLEELLDAQMLFGPEWPSEGRFVFKHALLQEAAYESLLRKERVARHAHIGRVLEREFPDLLATEPEVGARHHLAGQQWAPAASRWLEAGVNALGHNAHAEAIVHLERALESLANLPDDEGRTTLEADVQLTLLPALIAARGYGDVRVEEVGARCLALCEAIGDPLRHFTALFPICTFHMVRANHAEALRLAVRLHGIATGTQDVDLQIEANLVLGLCRFFAGELGRADEHLAACLAAYDAARHAGHAQRFGQDPAVVALSYRSWIRWLEGDVAASETASNDAIALARAGGHALSLAFALAFAAWRSAYARDGARAGPWVEELLTLCERQAIPVFHVHGRVLMGWIACDDDRPEDGVPVLRAALRAFQDTGSQCYLSYWLAFLASAEAAAGDLRAAEDTIGRALAELDRSAEEWSRPEVLRLAAAVAEARGEPDAAERLLDQALGVAAERDARTWELRVGSDLAEKLWRRGRRADARARLDDVIGRLPPDADGPEASTAARLRETFDTPCNGRTS